MSEVRGKNDPVKTQVDAVTEYLSECDAPAEMEHRPAWWTHDDEAAKDGGHLYYFAPANRAPPPYKTQRHVKAIIDIAADGTLAGVELIDDMPPPPTKGASPEQETRISLRTATEIETERLARKAALKADKTNG